jgi:hypothetical protein
MVTGPWPAARARRFLLACCATSILLASAAVSAQAAQIEAPSHSLQVWNLNTHGMDTATVAATGRTNYRQFVSYITDPARVAYYPDIVTLQEAGTASLGLASCHQFEADLQARTGLDYYCVETTDSGGAAVVYNTTRLSRQSANGGKVRLYKIDGVGNCNLSDWYSSTLRLKDDVDPTKFVNVESVHLPTANYPANASGDSSYWATDCAWNNMKLTSPGVTGLGSAAMNIMAGDWNHADANATDSFNTFGSWECWYSAVNTPDLGGCLNDSWGFKDAMYRQCIQPTAANTYLCLHIYHKSYGNTRIDFLFAKAYAVSNQVTVGYPEAYASAGSPAGAPTQYSDHRGQGSLVKYYP